MKFQRSPDLVRSCGTILILGLFVLFLVGLVLAHLGII